MDDGLKQLCELAIKKQTNETSNKNNEKETKLIYECLSTSVIKAQKCQDQFSEKMKGETKDSKAGLIRMFEGQNTLTSCLTQVSIELVNKYY